MAKRKRNKGKGGHPAPTAPTPEMASAMQGGMGSAFTGPPAGGMPGRPM